MDTELVAALLGALVGGAASLAGSVIINRLQLRREMRIRIYYELIPKLLKSSFTISENRRILPVPQDKLPSEFRSTVRDIERAAVIAGRGDLAMVKRLNSVIAARDQTYVYLMFKSNTNSEEKLSDDDRMELVRKDGDIGRLLLEFSDYLARKLV
jgi:hypothetical protein